MDNLIFYGAIIVILCATGLIVGGIYTALGAGFAMIGAGVVLLIIAGFVLNFN